MLSCDLLKVQLLPIILNIVWCTQQTKKRAFPKWLTLIWWAGFTQYPLWHVHSFISVCQETRPLQWDFLGTTYYSPKFGTFLAFNLWNLFQELGFRHLQVTNISLSTPWQVAVLLVVVSSTVSVAHIASDRPHWNGYISWLFYCRVVHSCGWRGTL